MTADPARRVVITGMGWVTPLGSDVDSTWTKLLAGASAIGPVTRFPARTFATNFAAEVKNFEIADFFADFAPDWPHAGAHVHSLFALAATAQAWKQAGLGDPGKPGQRLAGAEGLDPGRVGVYLGAGEGVLEFDGYAAANVAGWDIERRAFDSGRWAEAAYKKLSPVGELEQEPHMPVAHVAEAFHAFGPAFNCMTACAASTQAIGEAMEIIARGDADMMLAGGAHSMIHPLGMTGFIKLTAMSTRRDEPATAARPFDATRDGFVMGEGAGMLVLESLEHARNRGATPLAEVAGYGSSADAYRITDIQPAGDGAVAAMREALDHAGIDPASPGADGAPPVQYISAHGTGTQENDAIETAAVKAVFGELAPKIPFSSIKSMMGHLIQAAGAVELITCVQAMRTGFVPPTMNLSSPDPKCDLDYVPNRCRDLSGAGGVKVAMSNSFGFGGQNDALLVRTVED
jgi:3-oxoacyl-[acyl-carrier-protein] synthase II